MEISRRSAMGYIEQKRKKGRKSQAKSNITNNQSGDQDSHSSETMPCDEYEAADPSLMS